MTHIVYAAIEMTDGTFKVLEGCGARYSAKSQEEARQHMLEAHPEATHTVSVWVGDFGAIEGIERGEWAMRPR